MPSETEVPGTSRLALVRRFLVLGGANTLLTFAMFTAMQHLTEVAVAYTMTFAAGLVFTTALTPRVVFHVPTTLRRRLTFAGCYLVIYGVGLLVSHLLAFGGQPAWAVSAGTIAATAPLSFLAGQAVFTSPRPPQRGTRRSP